MNIACEICDVHGPVTMLPDRTGLVRAMCKVCAQVTRHGAELTHDHRGGVFDGPRLLHPAITGAVARVHVGLSVADLQAILEGRATTDLVLRALRALQLLDAGLAEAYARSAGVVL